MLCTCPRDALCDVCLEASWMQLRGVAARRGEAWAVGTATEGDRELLVALARKQIEDVTRDPRLLERLAGVTVWWAVPALRRMPYAW